MTFFTVIEYLTEFLVVFKSDSVWEAHDFLYVFFLVYTKKFIDLFVFKRIISYAMNFFQIKHNCISEICSVKSLWFVCETSSCHLKCIVHLRGYYFCNWWQKLCASIVSMNWPGEFERINIFFFLMIKIFMLINFSSPVLCKNVW